MLGILLPNGQVLAAQVFIEDPILGPVPWDGSISVSIPPPVGAATAAKQDVGNASLASIDGKLTNPLPISGAVTIPAITFASPQHTIVDSGSIGVNNFPGTQPVSGTVAVSNMIPSVETGLAKDA